MAQSYLLTYRVIDRFAIWAIVRQIILEASSADDARAQLHATADVYIRSCERI